MAVKGERFELDLDSYEDVSAPAQPIGLNLGLVKDIQERVSSSKPIPPSAPKPKNSGTGFPAHKTRTGASRFMQRSNPTRTHNMESNGNPDRNIEKSSTPKNVLHSHQGTTAKDPSIDQENKQRLAQMSDKEIEEERLSLMTSFSPSLIQRLLKKANIDNQNDIESLSSSEATQEADSDFKFVATSQPDVTGTRSKKSSSLPNEDAPPDTPLDLHPASQPPVPSPPTVHFPAPPKPPDLDPADPEFLSNLHSTYFPSLPADPSTMAWMTPLNSASDKEFSYSPTQESFSPSALRFDFRGHLLPPRLASQIPVTKGLHHHAHAPGSAGYTIPELAHIARSTYPAQRCIAFQTLGRILYRLGRGDYGQDEGPLSDGLWRLIEGGKVIEIMTEAAAREEGGSRSVWVTATEAIWLWRKGGGRRWRGR
ncbi:hypothetical protein MMC21_001897 [Puttea exsequens]|nr:hypothetical protein [Puttea exsequens]